MLKKQWKIFLKFMAIGMLVLVFHLPKHVLASEKEVQNGDNYYSFLEKNENVKYFEGIAEVLNEDIEIVNQQSSELTINAPETGLYYLTVDYTMKLNSVLPTQVSMSINQEVPYRELANLKFKDNWQLEKKVEIDRYGNEISPKAKALNEKQSVVVRDSSLNIEAPLAILLKKGENMLRFTSIEGDMTIHKIVLHGQAEIDMLQLEADPEDEVAGNERILIEAESVDKQNSSSIHPSAAFDNNLTPYNSTTRVLNFLDGLSFSKAGDKIYYEIDVPESGYYYFTMNYRQDAKINFPVFLNIAIDGQIPSESLLAQPIPYSNSFKPYTIENQTKGKSLPIYLEAGAHELSLEITGSPTGVILDRVSSMIKEMQALSLQVDNLLGSNTDRNRDINLETYLPGTIDQLNAWIDELADFELAVQEIANIDKTPGAFSQLMLAKNQLQELVKEPRKLANRMNELSKDSGSVTATLAGLLQEANNHGISIDQLIFHQTTESKVEKVSVFNKMSNSVKRFFNSFGQQDYTVDVNSKNLQVWVNRPRQYVELMQQMIDQEFTAQTGIKVDLSLMPDANKLILSNASGTAPDVALGINYAMPFDMAIREALVDLSQFDGFDELMSQYPSNLLKPATIGSEVFAVPETMNFYVLFYRSDILESLGLEVPNTMNEMVEMLPALNQRGMSAFYPTATLGTSFKIFPWTMPVVYQNGGSFFTEDITKTGLNSDVTIDGMQELTDLFTIYNMPKDVPSFYQQFRDGSIPIGIADYSNYNLLLNAAPEIANVWDLALMPGYEDKLGNVQRWSSGGAESAIMFESSEEQEDSWMFMQWWLSDSIQQEFGTNLQMAFGSEYMWNTANLKAFQELPWPSVDKNVILAQSEWIEEVPRALGGYMVEREVSNVYNSVVVDGKTLRKSIDLSAKRINRETMRKLEEFGFYLDGEKVIPYPMLEKREESK